MSYCPNCGTETLQGASFCVNCGSRLPDGIFQPTPTPPPHEEPPLRIPPIIIPPVEDPLSKETTDPAPEEELSSRQATPAAPPLEPTEQATPARKRPFWFLAHWRGEFSLGVSYWGMGIVLYIMIFILAIGAGGIASNLSSAYELAGFWITFWGGTIALQVWLWTGVWRSANNHVSRGGKAGWATAAKFMVVLAILQSIGQFTSPGGGLQNITEAINHVGTIHSWSKFEIKALRNGQEILIRGSIGEGIADTFEKSLLANPNARVVQIDSPGGLIVEAKRIRELIRSKGMTTFAPRECTSAATVIFMGGVERFMADTARLGFHQPNLPTLDEEAQKVMIAKEENYMIASGVSREFMTRAYTHKGSDIWYPNQRELLAAGVITGVTHGDEFGMTAIEGWKEKNKGELGLLTMPVYQALKNHEPEAYGKILRAFNETMNVNGSINELRATTIPVISEVATRRLPKASDGSVIAFAGVMVAEMDALFAVSPDLCYSLIYPPNGVVSRETTRNLPQELIDKELAVVSDIINSYDPKRPIPSEAEISKDLEKSIRILGQNQGGEAVSNLVKIGNPKTRNAVNKRDACTTIIGFYKSVLSLPQPKAVRTLRYLLSGK